MISQGILFLVLGTASLSLFQITLRLSQRKGRNMITAICINYLVAFFVCYIAMEITGNKSTSPFVLYFGFLTGNTFLIGLLLVILSFNQKGVALTGSIVQLAVVVPAIFSILLWNEKPSVVQILGIMLSVISLPLLNKRESGYANISSRVVFRTIALFFVNGFCMSSGKVLIEEGYTEQEIVFYLIVFATAFLASIPLLLIRNRKKPSRSDFYYGSVAGGLNAIANLGLIKALTEMRGSIVFPLYSSIGLLITVCLSLIIFDEKMSKTNVIGLTTCLGALILVNL